jgi:hypothetical protein
VADGVRPERLADVRVQVDAHGSQRLFITEPRRHEGHEDYLGSSCLRELRGFGEKQALQEGSKVEGRTKQKGIA